jgi:aspartyl-tRNA(Asn)/glutamyl-tRNA(Gln) amidotransferase subunit C
VASKLTRADVAKIAELARLDLTPRELDLFATQLTDILEYAAVIEQADTSGVVAADLIGAAPLRLDSPAASTPRDQALGQAPDASRDAGLFRVPKVL